MNHARSETESADNTSTVTESITLLRAGAFSAGIAYEQAAKSAARRGKRTKANRFFRSAAISFDQGGFDSNAKFCRDKIREQAS